MAVTSVKEVWSERAGSYDERAAREYTRSFLVTINDAGEGVTVAGAAVDPVTGQQVPRIHDVYTDRRGNRDVGAVCRKLEVKQDQDDPFTWRVTANYSSTIFGGASNFGRRNDAPEQARDGNTNQNPLSRPTVVKWNSVPRQRYARFDMDGKPLVNSAGDFYPAHPLDDSQVRLTFSRNEASFNSQVAGSFKDAVNSQPFFGYAAGMVKVENIDAESAFENGVYYWKVGYAFHIRTETIMLIARTVGSPYTVPTPVVGWHIEEWLQDKGRRKLLADGTRDWITDGKGVATGDDTALDGAGHVLNTSTPGTPLFYNQFRFYNLKDLNTLQLP
jgi:hypothetical protein